MLATDHLLFVHLHKSGGTFVNQFLLRHGQNPRQVGYHLPYREAPAQYRDLPVVATVRSPLGYYVSWYHFQKGMRQPNALFGICSDGGTRDFSGTIRNMLWLERDDVRLRLLEGAMPEDFQRNGLNLTRRCVRDLRGSGLGFYSFLFKRMFEGGPTPRLILMERIRADLLPVLSDLGETFDDDALAFVREVPDLNTSAHSDVASYFDQTLLDEVYEREMFVFSAIASLGSAPEC